MRNSIKVFIEILKKDQATIEVGRKEDLNLLAQLIHAELEDEALCNLLFICTHNSRRSQLGEFLLRIIAAELEIEGIHTFSGGTEATAFNYRMVKALENFDFHFDKSKNEENPRYLSKINSKDFPQVMFSKVYDHEANPQEDFVALMVCDHADENCPVVMGAKHRISLPYLDPKSSDDTPEEANAYIDKVKELGREMLFLCETIKNQN